MNFRGVCPLIVSLSVLNIITMMRDTYFTVQFKVSEDYLVTVEVCQLKVNRAVFAEESLEEVL